MRSAGPSWNDEHETRPVVFQGTPHPVAGHGAVLKAEAAAATLSGVVPSAWRVTGMTPPGRGTRSDEWFG
jgi:hypothetical protein